MIGQAARLLEKNDFVGAERIFVEVLRATPDHPDALCQLGILRRRQQRHDEALELLERAVRVAPSSAPAHYSLGNCLLGLRRFDEAAASFRRAAAVAPNVADIHNNLGVCLAELGRWDEAIAAYRDAARLRPGFAGAHYNVGKALVHLNRHREAIEEYRRVIRIDSNAAEVHLDLGNALAHLDRWDEAITCYLQAIRLRPNDAVARHNLGVAQSELGLRQEAIDNFRKACAMEPGNMVFLFDLGKELIVVDRIDEGLPMVERVIEAEPLNARAWIVTGHTQTRLNRYPEAIARYRHAIAIDPENVDAHWDLSHAELALGNFEQGWKEYEWRWRTKAQQSAVRPFAQPVWLGETDIAGKTLLVHAEQGHGDTIQFVRLLDAPALRETNLILEVQPALKALLSASYPRASVFARGEGLPEFDLHVPLLSLPLALGIRLETIPGAAGYLTADAQRRRDWSTRLREKPGLCIGLVASGNPWPVSNRARSAGLAAMKPVVERHSVRFFNIQPQLSAEERAVLAGLPGVEDLGPLLTDFNETAALVCELDLIISIDTSTAHLAGALGHPAWVMLSFPPDWRWHLDRDDSPWYDSLRLFRQERSGDWSGCIQRVAAALDQYVSAQQGLSPRRD